MVIPKRRAAGPVTREISRKRGALKTVRLPAHPDGNDKAQMSNAKGMPKPECRNAPRPLQVVHSDFGNWTMHLDSGSVRKNRAYARFFRISLNLSVVSCDSPAADLRTWKHKLARFRFLTRPPLDSRTF